MASYINDFDPIAFLFLGVTSVCHDRGRQGDPRTLDSLVSSSEYRLCYYLHLLFPRMMVVILMIPRSRATFSLEELSILPPSSLPPLPILCLVLPLSVYIYIIRIYVCGCGGASAHSSFPPHPFFKTLSFPLPERVCPSSSQSYPCLTFALP